MKKSLHQILIFCLALGFYSSVVANENESSDSLFERPVFLTVGEKPMNEDGQIMYPSPAVFDIDNDGKKELVLGSIFGGVFSCEDESTVTGKHDWAAPEPVNTTDGKPLRLNNW